GKKYERDAQKLRMEKLGLAYLFEEEINEAEEGIASTKINNAGIGVNLYFSALCFRLLRQHGHDVSLGMLELYECSRLALEGEDELCEAKPLCNCKLREIHTHRNLAKKVEHLWCIAHRSKVAELERGDAPSSILCYMREANASEEMARTWERIIIQTLERINKIRVYQPPSGRTFVNLITNVARVAQRIYQYGDGFDDQDHETKADILSLLIEPLTLG
ncbi:Terpene synthase, N-terminal domain, partial [Dillenia turbinata]